MASLAIPLPARRPEPEHTARRPVPVPRLHSPESMAGIPYYDDELDMAQSIAHSKTIQFLGPLLERVATAAGLFTVSDNPVWYWIPEERGQRALYPEQSQPRAPTR